MVRIVRFRVTRVARVMHPESYGPGPHEITHDNHARRVAADGLRLRRVRAATVNKLPPVRQLARVVLVLALLGLIGTASLHASSAVAAPEPGQTGTSTTEAPEQGSTGIGGSTEPSTPVQTGGVPEAPPSAQRPTPSSQPSSSTSTSESPVAPSVAGQVQQSTRPTPQHAAQPQAQAPATPEPGATPKRTSAAATPASPNPHEPSTPAPSPSALLSSSLAFTRAGPLLNLFLSTYRIPPFLLPIYLAAAQRYGVPWQVLAAINEVESDYGFDMGPSSAGAEGWMQFLPEEWLVYGVDANGAGERDPDNPADAIFATARYLAAADATHNLKGAIYAYNHSSSYVESVILRSQLIAATPQSLISDLTAVVSGRFPVEGSGQHTATPVWTSSTQPLVAPSSSAGHPTAAQAPAPPPQLAAAAGTSTPNPAVAGASVAASPDSSVVAVQNAEVIHTGDSAALGRFIELRDAYGDIYTYAKLGRVLKRYSLAPGSSRDATPRKGDGASPRARLAPLRTGAWVPAGTVLGNVPGGAPGTQVQLLFELRPAGSGPIDPRPLLQSWQLLGETQGLPQQGAQPLFGPDAGDAVINEIELLSEHQLQAHLLADPQLRLTACEQENIGAGLIDRRVLATLDFLLASGLDPTISPLDCGRHSKAAAAQASDNARGDAVTLTALNGDPISGHDRPGSLAELTVRRLLALPAAMKPTRVIEPSGLKPATGAVRSSSTHSVEVDFAAPVRAHAAQGSATETPAASAAPSGGPPAAAVAGAAPSPSSEQLEPELGTAQWRKLIAHIAKLSEPRVPRTPTSAAVPDNQTSPLPTATSLPDASPLPSTAPAPATTGRTGAAASKQPAPGPAESGLASRALAAPLTTPLLLGPEEVVLETEDPPTTESVLKEEVTLKALTGEPADLIQSVQFEIAPTETTEWQEIPPEGLTSTVFKTTEKPDGLYNLRVVVTDTAGGEHVAELPDRLVANTSPVVTLRNPGTNLRETVTLSASVPPAALREELISSLTFEVAPSFAPTTVGAWTELGKVALTPRSSPGVTTTLNAKEQLPNHGNGDFDFRVVPTGTETYASIPVRKRLVDNTPPTVSVANPGPLKGQVTLDASAADAEPGSGVASVRFQARSRVGTNAWRNIGRALLPSQPGGSTYAHSLNSESLPNGSYDLRAIAEDMAGNEATSATVEGVEVDNTSIAPATSASIAGVVAPAQHIGFLGAVQGGSEHEAWAYGFTSAPPAEVEGKPLPYTAEGEQLVLLRYTDKGGWQIADVPRELNGEPYRLVPADKVSDVPGGKHFANAVKVSGAMTPSGEAWLWVAEDSTERGDSKVGLFHRAPGGQFVYDAEATGTLHQPLGSSAVTPGLLEEELHSIEPVNLRLGESEGQVYGVLTATGQTAQAIPNSAVQGKLKFGLLQGHTWTLQTATPPPALLNSKAPIELKLSDVQGPGELWAAFEAAGGQPGLGFVLGHYTQDKSEGKWEFPKTGLDALELSGAVGEESSGKATLTPTALKAAGGAVWIEAGVALTPGQTSGSVVARYEGEGTNGHVTNSWCSLPGKNECQEPLDPDETAVPDAIFNTEGGEVALALKNGFVDTFAHDRWSSVVAPGYGPVTAGAAGDVFSSPNEGWLDGAEALGHWSTEGSASSLSSWPLPNRSPLTSVALPDGGQGEVGESGTLAVGLNGTTLSYDANAGWLVRPVPSRARHVSLLGVAFDGPSTAFAVGGSGVILRWNGTSWSEDPQSVSLTNSQLNAVAFAPSGEGWAVGANGTILHYDGESWSIEQPPQTDSGVDITSVAVAGSEVFAVAGGNLITRTSGGEWQEVEPSRLPSQPELTPGNLRLVAGLPDGGLVAAGRSVELVREAGQAFRYAAQPLQGIAVALAPFRDASGKLRAYVSVAPPAAGHNDIAAFPPGDGELLRQTESGWQDLTRAQYAGAAVRGDGAVKSDPMLAVATSADGEHAWAVGGYDGTEDAAEQGTEEPPVGRSAAWQTASIWRYDTSGSAQPPELTPTKPSLPAKQGTVSFAFFTSPMCREQCASVQNAQPDVNLTSAAKQIASYAAEPGGPAFAMLGGNAVGPLEESAYAGGNGAADFAHLPELLAPFGDLPTFAALGSFDSVPTRANQTQPWAEAFGDAPPPFGSGPAAPGITPVSSGAPTGEAHRFYAFDATQNGATVRVIVLDNAAGSLEGSTPGQQQIAWLREQLANAQGANVPVVVVTARPLRNLKASDGEGIASLLAGEGVVAVFTTDGEAPGNPNSSGIHELDERHLIPENPAPGVVQIPEYEGASLGYQQNENNGVVWYFASIDTNPGERAAQVEAVPVIESLSLKPVEGLSVARSLTLQFEAVGRRPAGTLATRAGEGTAFQGFDSYVEIPAPPCSNSRPCVQPSYAFTSSEPTIGDFVEPSAPGSPFPKLNSSGHPITSHTSGLFCAYNSGTTTVSITAGLLSYSQVVTVQPGGFGSPCGTVFRAGVAPVIRVHSSQTQRKPNGAAAPPPPPPAAVAAVSPSLSFLPPPPACLPPRGGPPQAGAPPPPPAPIIPEPPVPPPPLEEASPIPTIVPPATPPVEPIPPGGAAQAPSTAKREEKARKHASQSAFTIRPAGVSSEQWLTGGEQWFYGAVGVFTVLALMLTARGLPLGPRPRPALLENRPTDQARRRRPR
jgi:hypothetical protein